MPSRSPACRELPCPSPAPPPRWDTNSPGRSGRLSRMAATIGGRMEAERSVLDLASRIGPASAAARKAALARHDRLVKPPGSLGRLEATGAWLASVAGVCPPPVPRRPVVLIAAGDHGVHAQ